MTDRRLYFLKSFSWIEAGEVSGAGRRMVQLYFLYNHLVYVHQDPLIQVPIPVCIRLFTQFRPKFNQYMADVILMPRLSDTMTEGVIAAWHKKWVIR